MNKFLKGGTMLLLVFIVGGFFILPLQAFAFTPFGGPITFIFPCVNGLKVSVGPPRGGTFMYVPGASFSYAYGPPRRPGQYLLGLFGPLIPCFVPCPPVLCIRGYGNFIIFHGSSR